MDKDSFFNSVKDKLCFIIRMPENRGEKEELQKVNSKEGNKYLLAYVEKDDLIEDKYDMRKLSFKEYTDIVFDNFDINGVAIYNGGEYSFYDYRYFLQQQMQQEWEAFLDELDREGNYLEQDREKQIEEYHHREYIKYMENMKKARNMGAYGRTYDILCFLVVSYARKAGELLYYCGRIFEEVGNSDSAEQMYREAVRREPNNYWLYYQLAQFYRKIGKLNQEKAVYVSAYKHHRFYSNSNIKLQNDGIQYVLNGLIQHESIKKKLLEKRIYMKYAKEVNEKYADLLSFETYNYLDD